MKKLFDGKAFERYSQVVGITSLEEAIERKAEEEKLKRENNQKFFTEQQEKRERELQEYEAWYNEFNELKSEDSNQ